MDANGIAEELQDTNLGTDEEATDVESSPVPEKMLTASQVNELVKRAKRKGEQKMQEQLDAARKQIEELQAQAQGAAPQQGIPQNGITPEQQAQIAEQVQKVLQQQEEQRMKEQLEQEVNQVAQQYLGKMAQGKDMFDDFEAVTADFDPREFPQLVFLATQMDNTAAIIYELKKNPSKLADILTWIDKSPSMARSELGKLSKSIQDNENAKRTLQEAPDPLSRLKPSPVGTDGGTKTVRDYKSASYLRA